MQDYKADFIDLAQRCEALRFGEFTLKSGRVSPYFFNAGYFHSGAVLATLGRCYAAAIIAAGVEFDVLLGPAYKGIPLGTATAVALAEHFGRDVPFAYNRKEAKAHGEGGMLVGAPLQGRVLVIDDVITAGTAVRGVIEMIESAGATLAGVVIGLDRQERGQGAQSSVQELQQVHGVPVFSIATLADLIGWLSSRNETPELLLQMEEYREKYGAKG